MSKNVGACNPLIDDWKCVRIQTRGNDLFHMYDQRSLKITQGLSNMTTDLANVCLRKNVGIGRGILLFHILVS